MTTFENLTALQEVNFAFNLAKSPDFVKLCAETSKLVGFTASEWNNNKVAICVKYAFLLVQDAQNGVDKAVQTVNAILSQNSEYINELD